jgi:Helix-turn-helix domain
MSFQAVEYAFALIDKNPDLTPPQRFVLITIAHHANPETGRAFPGVTRLMKMTGLSRRAVYGATARLRKLLDTSPRSGAVTIWQFPRELSPTSARGAPVDSGEPVHVVHPPVHVVHRTGARGAPEPKENRKEQPSSVPFEESTHPALVAERRRNEEMATGTDGARVAIMARRPKRKPGTVMGR